MLKCKLRLGIPALAESGHGASVDTHCGSESKRAMDIRLKGKNHNKQSSRPQDKRCHFMDISQYQGFDLDSGSEGALFSSQTFHAFFPDHLHLKIQKVSIYTFFSLLPSSECFLFFPLLLLVIIRKPRNIPNIS